MRIIILLSICLLILTVQTMSQKLEIESTADFEVNAKGNSPEWNKTDWIHLTQRSGEVDYSTKVKILHSPTGMYFLFDNEDEMITSTQRKDFEDLWEEDVVEVFLWTDESIPLYFEYELSPYNYELPILVPNNKGDFLGWRPWKYEGERKARRAARIVEENGKVKGWIAQFFIPYALLKPLNNVPPTSGTEWKINMYRIDHDKGMATWTWQPVRTNFHDYESFGTVIFK